LSAIATNFIGAQDMAAEFARFLGDMLDVYQSQTSAQKLLFIIDGLDEIRHEEKENRTIFDCIPHSDILDEGVYIILTGRHKNETAQWIREKYDILESKAVLTKKYSRADDHNTRTLESYLSRQLYVKKPFELESEEAKKVKTVIEKGDYRFLYVKALRELLKADNFDINEVSGGNIMERYLKVLESRYGTGKHYEKMKRLLLIAALLDEPALIEELSYLFSFEPADFKFIGYLTDLKGLLHIDRTGAGETISASVGAMHDDWKKYLVDGNKKTVQGIIEGWIDSVNEKVKRYKSEESTVLDNITSGESYLAANIYSLSNAYFPEIKSFFSDENVMDFLSSFAEIIAEDSTIISAARAEKIYTGIIANIETQTEAFDEEVLADYYIARGIHRSKLQLLDGALSDYDRCIDIKEDLQNEKKLSDVNDLAIVYLTRGDVYFFMTEYCKAVADFDRCVEILEGLRNDEIFDESYLATAYNDRGLAYWSMTEYAKAIAEYDKSVEIMERLRSEGELIDENLLSLIFMNTGSVYNSMEEYAKAIAEYDKSVEIMERLRNEEELYDENNLAMVYMNRGLAYNSITEYDKAIAENDRCIEIWERLRNTGKLIDENNLAKAYLNKGLAYNSITEYEKAIAENDRCIEIWERLRDIGKLFDENNLAMAYLNRGVAFLSMEEYDKAISQNDKCIKIWEMLLEKGKLFNESFLGKAYLNRGLTFDKLAEYDKAIIDLDKYVEILKQLQDKGKLFDENDLTEAYFYRGNTYNSMTEYKKAITDYDKCLEIMEKMHNAFDLYDEDDFSTVNANKKAAMDAMNAD